LKDVASVETVGTYVFVFDATQKELKGSAFSCAKTLRSFSDATQKELKAMRSASLVTTSSIAMQLRKN
jgi:hypothetical protein